MPPSNKTGTDLHQVGQAMRRIGGDDSDPHMVDSQIPTTVFQTVVNELFGRFGSVIKPTRH